ncbi:MAG TPA: SUMF1/EgtB/PvdO family nonheme iron enzyme [Gemmatimonadota bacterium]|nr:SUMF1/EgtB/PvdO family nonheme iron enzyme [Gemmatimonadota bacterium]
MKRLRDALAARMRAARRPIVLEVAGRAAVALLVAYGALRFADRLILGPDPPDAIAHPVAPPGARDSLNPAVWIAGGSFRMGSHDPGLSKDPASPFSTWDERRGRKPVRVRGFFMQEHPVTNREYRRFDPAHAYPPGRGGHPVTGVTWEEAMAYAEWLGGTLPKEPQWEYAARGTAGRKYPWGDRSPTCRRAHFQGCDPEGTIPVMSLPAGATPRGIYGLAGNVWEWVTPEWFDRRTTPVNDESRGLRGGSFRSPPFFLRAANRSNGYLKGFTGQDVGFRVAWPGGG